MPTVQLGLSASPSPSPTLINSNNNLATPTSLYFKKSLLPSRVSRTGDESSRSSSLCNFPKSGVCRASQAVELFPSVYPEIVVREARLEDCWEVAETHCSSFFPEYSFPLDLALRVDRLMALLSGFSVPNGCRRTCLVAVVGSSVDDKFFFGSEELKVGGLEGKFSFSRRSIAGILTIDTVADFLPRKGPLRQRRVVNTLKISTFINLDLSQAAKASITTATNFYQHLRTGIAYISNVAVRERNRRKGIAKRLIEKAEVQARNWGCRAIALHCDVNNPAATQLYNGQGFKCIKVPERANWPQPKTSPNVQFDFMMKLLTTPTTS